MARVLEQIDIELMKPADAPGVSDLFKAYYGEDYPVKTFYDPEKLIEANEAKSILSVVAKNEAGAVVGHAAVYHSSPYEKLYEQGAILVRPDYQRKRCSVKSIALATTMEAIRIAKETKIAEGIFGETVCNHIHTQKFAYRLGDFFPTAFEVDLMPAEAYVKSGEASGRVSALLNFEKTAESSRTVYMPSKYKEYFEYIYEPLKLDRTFKNASLDSISKAGSKTTALNQFFEFANTSRVTINDIGSDFSSYSSGIENEADAKGGIVFQYWLPLDSPHIEFALSALREKGYFFGGILPLWNNTDSLLMQKIKSDVDWNSQRIFSDRGKKIVGIVRNEMELVNNAH